MNTTETNKTRYSDEELEEFKAIILEKLKKANDDLNLLTDAYTNSGDNSTDDTSPTFKVLEEGQNDLSKEENRQLAARQERFIKNLEAAWRKFIPNHLSAQKSWVLDGSSNIQGAEHLLQSSLL